MTLTLCRSKALVFAIAICAAVSFTACSASKTSEKKTADSTMESAEHKTRHDTIKYSVYFRVVSSLTTPKDEIFIDTTGQMSFNTHQEMKSGKWKSPTGFAYLDGPDDDTLFYYISHNSLFNITQDEVQPHCPGGDIYNVAFYRSDLKKYLRLQTNTCAFTYNLLTGDQRTLFPDLMKFLERIRVKYRPRFPD